MNPLIKAYRSRLMKTMNQEHAEEATESTEADSEMTPVQENEGPSAISQLAKKMQGAGTKGWKSMSALFNKDDEHQLLEPENQAVADHPLASKPEEPRLNKRNMAGFWDNFATKWQQAAAAKQAETAASGGEGTEEAGTDGYGGGQSQEGEEEAVEQGGGEGNRFSKYASLGGGGSEETAFKWNFVSSKLNELKSKTLAKSN